jgi:type IV secretion system protein VirB9
MRFVNSSLKLSLIIVLASSLGTIQAHAESRAMPFAQDIHLQTFNYDRNNTYTINTRPEIATDVELADDERIDTVVVGNSTQWIIEQDTQGKHVFVKPTVAGLFTSATIITTKRTYQLLLKSFADDDKFFQRVTWNDNRLTMLKNKAVEDARLAAEEKAAIAKEEESKKQADQRTVWNIGTPIESVNFNYDISGTADFKPVQVFDDGRFTWLKFNSPVQELPALFAPGADDKLEVVNYIVKENMFMVQKVMPNAILKIGKNEVKITNKLKAKQTAKSSSFSFWN